ncbi:hypothetical protein [Nonlabens agnitus]|nr:hypothetical protein [Nonlabens agnitus]
MSSGGDFSGNVGISNDNGAGFNVSASSSGTYSIGVDFKSGSNNLVSLDFSLSSSGVGISGGIMNRNHNNKPVGGGGVGINISFANSISMGDYTVNTSGYMIPVIVPTPAGVFSGSFGKQKVRYFMSKNEVDLMSGPLSFASQPVSDITIYYVSCEPRYGSRDYECADREFNNIGDAQDYRYEVVSQEDCECTISTNSESTTKAAMDVQEVVISNNTLSDATDIKLNNLLFPAYDKYNIQAQGLSGNMSSRLFDNGALFGLPSKDFKGTEDAKFKITYLVDGGTSNLPDHLKFTQKPKFYMDNEISTHLGYTDVTEATFSVSTPNTYSAQSFYDNSSGVDMGSKPTRKTANYIEYFTNEEIVNQNLKYKGFLKPEMDNGYLDRSFMVKEGIGAFKITSVDGKTYHYSLPVYNNEIFTRTIGAIKNNDESPKQEMDSYFEKQQREPFATHWLLTAVTGPDYYDNNNDGIANDGDLGFWVSFTYGKWSGAFAWKTPAVDDYIISKEDSEIKTRVEGTKELYYLNSIKTRTHTALFTKVLRNVNNDGWTYNSVYHWSSDQNSNDFTQKTRIPGQNKLGLDKIVLFKNEDLEIFTINRNNLSSTDLPSIYWRYEHLYGIPSINNYDKVVMSSDITTELLEKAEKVIQFGYGDVQNGVRPMLSQVSFNGKGGSNVIPPYTFNYNYGPFNRTAIYQNDWGYNRNNPKAWSLATITTPTGSSINIDYEPHEFISVVGHEVEFNLAQNDKKADKIELESYDDYLYYTVKFDTDFGVQVNDVLDTKFSRTKRAATIGGFLYGEKITTHKYDGIAKVISSLGNNSFRVKSLFGVGKLVPDQGIGEELHLEASYTLDRSLSSAGVRAKSISTIMGNKVYKTEYSYGGNEDGVGYVSYLPYAPSISKELPYSAELPAPVIMYDNVAMTTYDINESAQGTIRYKFNILKEKSNTSVKFGDFYEIFETYSAAAYNNSSNKDIEISKFEVRDNLASIGQLLEVSSYNTEGQLLNSTLNEYYAAGSMPDNLGTTKESFQTYKEVDFEDSNQQDKWIINASTRVKYPNVLKSTKSISGGYTFESTFDHFNPMTGLSDIIISEDSRGNRFKTESVSAYKIAEYNPVGGYGMGSKVDDITNKNMLSQQAMSKTYLDVGGTWKLTSADITTWNNNWRYPVSNPNASYEQPNDPAQKIWRKHKSYVWDGQLNADGTYQLNDDGTNRNFTGEYDGFNWGLGGYTTDGKGNTVHAITHGAGSNWKLASETTLYNHFSAPLEARDINGNHASTKYDKNYEKVISTVNAAYTEQYYSGAEDEANGLVGGHMNIWYHQDAQAHTGKYSENAGTGSKNFRSYPRPVLKATESSKRFRVSVWAHKANHGNARISVGGNLTQFSGEKVFAGDWVQLNHYFDLSGQTEVFVRSASGTVYFDDFRLHPVGSSMSSYVYNEWGELSYILGANNMATHYEYDDAGRLVRTYVETADNGTVAGGFKLAKEMDYRYKASMTFTGPPAPRNPLRAVKEPSGIVNACVEAPLTGGGQTANYQYKWAQSSNPSNLVYGNWTTDLCLQLNIQSCKSTFYKVAIRNVDTGVTKEWSGSYFNNDGCPPTDPGGGGPVLIPDGGDPSNPGFESPVDRFN